MSVGDIPGTRERLHIGDRVALNSGGPVMLVVDIVPAGVVASWRDAKRSYESLFSRVCLRRVFASVGSVEPSA